MNMYLKLRHLAVLGGLVSVLVLAFNAPAYALSDATASTNFKNVGNLGGTYGILIADNWVLTASHVAQSGVTFSTAYGSSVVDQAYLAPGAAFPDNDLALVHLSTAIKSDDLPTLNANFLTAQTAMDMPVTLANAGNYVYSTLVDAPTVINQNGVDHTVNYVVVNQDGSAAYLQSGDSGSTLFSGNVLDSTGLVLGVASSICGNTFSCYTQVAAYRTWIDSTLANYGDSAKWNVASVVPEPDTLDQFLLGCCLMFSLLAIRQQAHKF